jgi:hypothetical protein
MSHSRRLASRYCLALFDCYELVGDPKDIRQAHLPYQSLETSIL